MEALALNMNVQSQGHALIFVCFCRRHSWGGYDVTGLEVAKCFHLFLDGFEVNRYLKICEGVNHAWCLLELK